jgi:hypothetical protein
MDFCNWTRSDIIAAMALIVSLATCLIYFLTLIVLTFTLCWIKKQYDITQTLNQPFIGVKEVNVQPAGNWPAIKISATIINSGNYKARDAEFNYEFSLINKNNNPTAAVIEDWKSKQPTKMLILPKQEIDLFIMYIDKDMLAKLIVGYASYLELKITLNYADMESNAHHNIYKYRISRLLTDVKNKETYDVFLISSTDNTNLVK